ncbi:hypothetical protein EUGRSUZ_L02293 [Eucalyptus grandis]|uniref:Uncharacterized protein n=1 Tax=Eucalyptus grandis TaxID=71139 RepID=A0A058ZR49_EUCGR|nr:hypothetical protein EUGRSUZ_L02293 [Eucalyptus grandis]
MKMISLAYVTLKLDYLNFRVFAQREKGVHESTNTEAMVFFGDRERGRSKAMVFAEGEGEKSKSEGKREREKQKLQ